MYLRKISILLENATTMKATKIKKEIILTGLLIFNVNFGNFCAKNIPAMRGSTKIKKTDLAILKKSNPILMMEPDVSGSNPLQNLKLSGIKTTARSVAIAVSVTDNARFPLATYEKKLETLPPGQEATNNMPSANPGNGSRNQINRKVAAGSNKNCAVMPVKTALGFALSSLKLSFFSESETPNMIKANARFIAKRLSSEKSKCNSDKCFSILWHKIGIIF